MRLRALLFGTAATLAIALAIGVVALAGQANFSKVNSCVTIDPITGKCTTSTSPAATTASALLLSTSAGGGSLGPTAAFLLVGWRETGIGGGTTVQLADADPTTPMSTVVYGCINNGGNHPQAANKEVFVFPVSVTGTFTPDRNGQYIGSITSNSTPSAASLGFSCPPGQAVVMVSVQFVNMVLTDLTYGGSTLVPDASAVFIG